MKLAVLSPVGVKITDLALSKLDPDAVTEVQLMLAEHGVAIFTEQSIDDTEFIGFLRLFGDLSFTAGETPVPDFPDLNVISNVGRLTPPRSVFHVDTSYVRDPPAYTALRAVAIPSHGGQTLFTNQYRAFDTLPPDVADELVGRSIKHVVSGLSLSAADETSAEHPVLRRHPLTGRTALYISTPQRCVSISGMGSAQAQDMIEFLYAHSTTTDNTLSHAWSADDVVMWDNRCVLHKADHTDVIGDRVMHRGMVTAR